MPKPRATTFVKDTLQTIAAVAAAALARELIDSGLGTQSSYGPFYLAVVFAALRGGMAQALLATLLGLVVSWFCFVPPRFSFGPLSRPDQVGLAVFAVVGASIALLNSSMRSAHLRSRAAEHRSREERERMRGALASIGDSLSTAGDPLPAAPAAADARDAPHQRTPDEQHEFDLELQRQVDLRMRQLRASNELFRQLVEGTKDYAIFMLDTEGHVRSWNPGAERIKGYAASEIVGRHFSCFYAPEERKLPAIAARLETAARTGRFEEEGWRVRKDGTRFWASVLITALRDDVGELRGFSKITRDLTHKRAADENALRLAEAEAGRRAAEDVGSRLKESQDALREADRRKDEFLATLAHELRNPMAALRNGLHLLDLVDDPAESARTREMMERQVAQLVRLVDDLMDVGRIRRGKVELKRGRVTLASIIETALDTCGPLLRDGAHHVEVRVAPETLVVDADEIRLAQAIGNLLHNATKYTPPGGRISVVAGREGDRAVVRVRDDGAGIPPEMLERVFDMFTQVDRSLERSQGGLGIGLAIVRQLVEMHDGTVTAHSAGKGAGSEFVVTLPLASAGADAGAKPAAAAAPARDEAPPRRVLVVDDNADAAASMRLLLQRMGHEARTAADGVAGVESAASFRPDVVFLDLGMPRMNGLEAAKRIRAEPWGRGMVLVALTGWGQQEDVARARNAGFDQHMVKPVEAASIAKLLATLPRAPARSAEMGPSRSAEVG